MPGFLREPIHRTVDREGCQHDMAERRVMCQSLTMWEMARQADEAAPFLASIDLDHPNLKTHFYVVDVDHDEERFDSSRVSHCGGSLSAFCGMPVIGHALWDVLPRPIREEMTEFLKAVARLGKPMAESGGFLRADGGEILYRDAVMPVRAADGHDRLLGAISFRTVPA